MKSIKALIIIGCMFVMSNVDAQSPPEKEKEKQEYGFGLFSMEEFANLHVWIDDQVEGLELGDDIQIKYDTLFEHHLGKIGRYKDKENRHKILPEAEYLESIKGNISKLNLSVEPFLSKDQNKKHLELMAEFEKILKNKLSMKKG